MHHDVGDDLGAIGGCDVVIMVGLPAVRDGHHLDDAERTAFALTTDVLARCRDELVVLSPSP